MSSLLKKISPIKSIAGLSIVVNNGTIDNLSYVLLNNKKEGIQLLEQKENLSLEEFIGTVNNKNPLALTFRGNDTLTKVVEISDNSHSKNILNQVLPSAKATDFYLQALQQEAQSFASVIRKVSIDELIKKIEQSGYSILSISLDKLLVKNLAPYINNETIIQIQNEQLIFVENNLSEIVKNEQNDGEYLVDEYRLSGDNLIAFAAAFQQFLPLENRIEIAEICENNVADFYHRQLFEKLKLVIPLFFLMLLLVNFLCFSSFNKKNEELNTLMALNQKDYNELIVLENEVEARTNFLEQTNWLANSMTSLYADRIVAEMPNTIILERLNLFPAVVEKQDGNKYYSYETNTILIDGYTNSSLDLNEWKKQLKENDWIEEITVENYIQEDTNEEIFFELKIVLIE